MKKLIEKIRAAKTWRQRAEIAKDEWPGTAFDDVFRQAKIAKDFETKAVQLTRQCHERLGKWLAWIIQNEEIQTLHDMANALASWKRHKLKRKQDFDLEVLFSISGMFPPGWEKYWGKDPSSGKLVPGYTPISPGTRVKIAMRDIKRNLARIDPNFSEDTWESRRRKIQRYAKEFKIPLDKTPGYPPEKTRHNSRKKLR